MKLIKIDVDCVVANLTDEWINRYNARYDDLISRQTMKRYEFSQFVKYRQEFFDILKEPDLYDNIQPEPGAVEGVLRLKEEFGARVIYVTSCETNQFDQKLHWLMARQLLTDKRDYFGAKDKGLIVGDMMLDDYEGNFGHLDVVKVLFGQYWNSSPEVMQILYRRFRPDSVVRVEGWHDFTTDFYEQLREMYRRNFRSYVY